MPLLTNIAKRLLRRQWTEVSPRRHTEFVLALEAPTPGEGSAATTLREAARAQAAEHMAAVSRILAQARDTMRPTGIQPELEQRVPGTALHPRLLKAVGTTRMTYPEDARFADAGPPVEVLDQIVAGLRGKQR